MRQKIQDLIGTMLLTIIFSMTGMGYCCADTTSEEMQAYYNGVIAQQQINQSNHPKYAERTDVEEMIDPITGNLILKQVDIALPGKDGLDLNIGRIYHSSEDEYVKKVKVETKSTYNYATVETRYILWVGKRGLDSPPFSIGPVSQNEYNFYYDYWNTYEGPAYSTYIVGIEPVEVEVTYTDRVVIKHDYTDKYSYNKTRYYLGAGWAFSFPSVQIERENNVSHRYYHDSNGATYPIRIVKGLNVSNLEGYQGNDIQFLEDSGTYKNEDGVELVKLYIRELKHVMSMRKL